MTPKEGTMNNESGIMGDDWMEKLGFVYQKNNNEEMGPLSAVENAIEIKKR
jgi:hypothetical protein